MDLPFLTRQWQLRVLAALVGLSPVLVWRGIDDAFALPKATLTVVAAVVLLALGAARAADERRVLVPHHPLVWAASGFAAALAVTTLFSTDRATSVFGAHGFYAGLVVTGACLAVAFVVARIADDRFVTVLLGAMVAGAVLTGLYALVQRADMDPFDWGYNSAGFVFGTMGNPNFAAGMLGMAVPVAAGLALLSSIDVRLRLALAGAAVVCLAGALATTSFQGPAAATAGLIVVGAGLLHRSRESLIARWGAPRLAAGSVAALLVLGGVLLLGVDDLSAAVDNGLDERSLIWRTGIDVFADHPIMGTGPDTFGESFLAKRPLEHALRYGYTRAEQAHDVPLNTFATGGILLGLTYLAVVTRTGWVLVRGLLRTAGERAALLAAAGGGWVAYQVQSLVSLDTPTLLLWFWVLTAAVLVLGADPPFVERLLPGAARPTSKGKQRPNPPVSRAALGAIVAIAVLGVWFATRPLRAELAIARGQDAVNVGDVEGATREARRATELAGWTSEAWLFRTQVEEASRDVDSAVVSAANAARRDKGSPQLAMVAAKLYQAYKPQLSNPWWEEAVRRDPRNPAVLAAVATGIIVLHPERAAELAQQAVDIAPDHEPPWVALGDVRRAAGNLTAARDAYEHAVALVPTGDGAARLKELDEQPAAANG